MNFENLNWPKPLDSSDSEYAAELSERERADQIMAEQEMAEMEKTAELVAELEKKEAEEKKSQQQPKSDKKIYPKSQTHVYRSKETNNQISRKPAKNIFPARKAAEYLSKLNPEKEEGGEDDRPFSDIYPYSRNLNRR